MNRERRSAVRPQVYLGVDRVFWLLACFCGGCGLGWLGPLSCMVGTPLAVRQFLGLGPHPWLVLGLPACLRPLVPWHSCPWLWELCSLSPCWGGRTCVIGMCGLRFSMLLWGRGCWGLQGMLGPPRDAAMT